MIAHQTPEGAQRERLATQQAKSKDMKERYYQVRAYIITAVVLAIAGALTMGGRKENQKQEESPAIKVPAEPQKMPSIGPLPNNNSLKI